MNVLQLLKLKGSRAVETVSPDMTVAEAAEMLSAKRIGALVASSDGKTVAGILSERDIVRMLGSEGTAVLARPIHQVMTAEVMTCALTDSALSVLERMTEGRFRHMPVIEADQMVGFLSIGDVVKARISEVENDNAALVEMLHG
ncbi:MAG: CBS domain-containing protein [Pseudomonadota bacterium]